jgi:hypothetical protein
VNVAEQMERASMTLVPLVNREVEQDHFLLIDPDFFVVLTGAEVPSKFRSTKNLIVISVDQVDITPQAAKYVFGVIHTAKREVAQVVNSIPTLYKTVPIFNQKFIVFFQRAVWPSVWAERLDPVVKKMCVRGKPNITHVEISI